MARPIGGRFFAPQSGGRGRMGGPLAIGPGGECYCPECGYSTPHQAGRPCMLMKCPICGTRLRPRR